jgi:hypothetical protein
MRALRRGGRSEGESLAQPPRARHISSSLFGQITSINTARAARPRSIQLTAQVDF